VSFIDLELPACNWALKVKPAGKGTETKKLVMKCLFSLGCEILLL